MISVIIPLFNKEKTIAQALNGVLMQSYQDFEIVVINDGSTDGSLNEVQKFRDARIRVFEQKNEGVSSARNYGIQKARGEFVAFLDADDIWRKDHLETLFNLTEKFPQCDVFAVNYDFLDKDVIRHTIFHHMNIRGKSGILDNYFDIASCSNPPLWTSAVMVNKTAILSVGGFPVGITNGEDLLTWAKLALKYSIAFSKVPTAIYNLGWHHGFDAKPKNIPQGNIVGNQFETLLGTNAVLNEQLKLYISRWYKIRASLFLRGGERRNAIINIFKALKFNPLEWKIYAYMFFLILPNRFVLFIFKKLS